jgi:hypothetical protein
MKIADLDTALLNEAFRVALLLAPPSGGTLTFAAENGALTIHSTSDYNRCSILLPAVLEGSALFALPVEALKDAVKATKTVSLDIPEGTSALQVKSAGSAKYRARLAIMDALVPDPVEFSGNEVEFTKEQLQWLKEALTAVSLKPQTLLSPYTPAIIRLTKKGGFAACAHFGHMAFTSSETTTGDLDVTLPYDTIRAVLDAFEGDECIVSFSSSALRVRNAILDVVLALPDLRDAATIDQALEIAEMAKESAGESVILDYKEVKDFMARCKAIREKSKLELSFDATKDSTHIAAETTLGDAQMEFPGSVKKPVQFKIDAETFEELLAKSDKKEICLGADQEAGFVVMSNGPTYMVISMNTESYEDD